MTEPARHLAAVPTGEVPADAPSYGEALSLLEKQAEEIAGLTVTIHSQAGIIGKQRAELEERLENHPRRAEITRVIDHWRRALDHRKSKLSKDRVKLVADRLKDGYSLDQLALAIDGLAGFPYRSYGDRLKAGTPAQRDDKMSTALDSGEAVERFAVLGHRARKAGLIEVVWEGA